MSSLSSILSFWKNASPRRKRIYSVFFVFLVALAVTVIGTYIPLSSQDAQTISNQLNQTLNQNRASNTLVQYIFLNNFEICLLMFIPVVGAALGMFILFDTGVALGAIAMTQGYPAFIALFSEFLTPVFWLEFAAYSIAMAESIWLFRRLMQKRWRELKWTGIFIAICAVLLIVGAIVETWIITAFG
jgi:uncharacterized membrane protein SpoIIM required for sporulation